ncbi:hypothetical protein BT63DRAFT_461105 [Microthyrium microscopicum]|uniref:Uncharacterized protein n=1 Tax=Microthyrium microscopicum TaxID=703497 RepID=A0A6A6TYP7_9PEZI|nr:hypothetical protein BT63DRAFT_461105 [Microthyrium microscopicum]
MPYYPLHPFFAPPVRLNRPPLPLEKKRRAFVWPKDGRRDRTKFGRFMDIMQGKGPDIFVSEYGRKDQPTRGRWTNRNWLDRDAWGREHLDLSTPSMPWAKRRRNEAYNFRTSKYERERTGEDPWGRMYVRNPFVLTDARWLPGADADAMPFGYRCAHGDYHKWVHYP